MKVRVEKTIRRDGNTYIKGNILEVEDEAAKKLAAKGLVIPLDKELAEALAGELRETVREVKIPISYKDFGKFTHEELDEVALSLDIKVDGKKEEKVDLIWEHLSGDYLEEEKSE